MDERVEVELELSEDVILKLAMQAHEEDITLNQYINKILKLQIERGEEILKEMEKEE